MSGRITVRGRAWADERIVGLVRSAARLAANVLDVRHPLPVTIHADSVVVRLKDETYAWGFFDPNEVRIDIAGGLADELVKGGYSKEKAGMEVVGTFFHELVHYEQWRDGKPFTERGVDRRAARLMKQLGYDVN